MPVRMMSPTFIGRRVERSRLEGALERAAAGEPSIVLIGGDAGIGKTRLLTEFVAADRDAVVLSGGCLDLGEAALPYAPVVEALRELTRLLGPEQLRKILTGPRSELARLLPRADVERGHHGDEPASQSRLFEAVLSTLDTLGQDRPIILAIEDLHWADRSTLDLVVFLARNLGHARVVVLVTYRTDEVHRRHTLRPVLAELFRLPSVERVDLAPFDRDEVAEQLTAILGRAPDTQLVDAIVERSEGNAFYTEELLAAAERSGGHLPWTLREIVVSRLEPLPETAKEVLRIAAAAARSVDHRLLEEVADLPASDLRDGLREAVAHQALVPTEDGRSYRFRHALLQEAVHEELLPGERTELHAAFAAALTRAPNLAAGGAAGVHAELAHHWYAAHQLDRAFTASLAAAETAMGQYAFAEARHHDERALELWDRIPDDVRGDAPPRFDVLARAAHASGLAGDVRRAVAHQRAAIAAAGDAERPEVRAGLLGALSRQLWIAGEGEEALAVSEASIAAMPEEPSRDRAYALAWRGRLLMLSGRYEDALDPSQEAIDVARAVGAPLEESQALNSLGTSLAAHDDLTEGVALLRTSLGLAKEVGSAEDVLRAYVNLSSVLSAAAARGAGGATIEDSRRRDEAMEVSREGLRWAEDHGVVGPVVDFLRLNLMDDLFFLGHWAEVDREVEKLRIRPGDGAAGAHVALALSRLRVGQGRFGDAREYLEPQHERVGKGVTDPQFLIPIGESEACLALWEGRPEDARAVADRVMQLEDRRWWMDLLVPLAAWAEADIARRARAAGDAAAVAEAGRRMDRLMNTVRNDLDQQQDRPTMWAERLRGILTQIEAERSRMSGTSDPEAWRRVVVWMDEYGAAEAAVHARWRRAEALLEQGARDEAAEVLEVAHRRTSDLGAGALREQVEALARRARIALPGIDGDRDGELGLTPREREVLELVTTGLTNRAIGERLFITEKTASVHVSNILTKLGVSNRGEASAVARRLGLDRSR